MSAHDRFLAPYRVHVFNVVCPKCDDETTVTATTEYGATDWDPEACAGCGTEFEGDEVQRDAPTCWEEF